MVNVVLDELDDVGEKVSLSDDEATALSASKLVEVRPEGHDRWRLLPNGRVGAVRVSGHQVQVNPKDRVGVAHLLFLLGYAANPGFRDEDVLGETGDELWPALGFALARQVQKALQHGVSQGYRTTEEALRTVRGRIRISDQIAARPGLLMPLEVTYDDFTVDTAENQVLRAALRRMLAVPRLDKGVRRELLHLDGRLAGATILRPGAPLPQWTPSRMNERYQPALWLGELVLRNSAAEPGPGGLAVSSFVVSMPKVFEDFVTVALKEALAGEPGWTKAQYATHLDEPIPGARPALPMSVDVVHTGAGGRPVVAFDAKYKAARDGGGYPTSDYYQMLAYCTALDIPTAWLLYAQGGGTLAARAVRHTDKTIVEFALDLGVDPRRLLRQIGDVARAALAGREMRELAG